MVRLNDPYISRLHCELIFRRGILELRDNQSKGGTRLNGLRINQAIVLPRDAIKIGQTRLRIECRPSLVQPVRRIVEYLGVLIDS